MSSTIKFATGFITGSLVGLAFGILYAPKEGTKTRAMLKDKTKKYMDQMSDTLQKKYGDVKEKIQNRQTSQDETVN